MKICTCEKCRYIFPFPLVPLSCPDCGSENVRLATEIEIMDYRKLQEILNEEIRNGLIPA